MKVSESVELQLKDLMLLCAILKRESVKGGPLGTWATDMHQLLKGCAWVEVGLRG